MMLLNHSSLAVRELVGLARWLEARYFVTFDFVVDAVVVAAGAVTNEAAENAAGVEIVAEFVFAVVVAAAPNTVGFVGVALRPG